MPDEQPILLSYEHLHNFYDAMLQELKSDQNLLDNFKKTYIEGLNALLNPGTLEEARIKLRRDRLIRVIKSLQGKVKFDANVIAMIENDIANNAVQLKQSLAKKEVLPETFIEELESRNINVKPAIPEGFGKPLLHQPTQQADTLSGYKIAVDYFNKGKQYYDEGNYIAAITEFSQAVVLIEQAHKQTLEKAERAGRKYSDIIEYQYNQAINHYINYLALAYLKEAERLQINNDETALDFFTKTLTVSNLIKNADAKLNSSIAYRYYLAAGAYQSANVNKAIAYYKTALRLINQAIDSCQNQNENSNDMQTFIEKANISKYRILTKLADLEYTIAHQTYDSLNKNDINSLKTVSSSMNQAWLLVAELDENRLAKLQKIKRKISLDLALINRDLGEASEHINEVNLALNFYNVAIATIELTIRYSANMNQSNTTNNFNFADILFKKGAVLKQLSRHEEAIECFKKAIQQITLTSLQIAEKNTLINLYQNQINDIIADNPGLLTADSKEDDNSDTQASSSDKQKSDEEELEHTSSYNPRTFNQKNKRNANEELENYKKNPKHS